eukprot:c16737_g1_i1.p2 GENE.c16737_g1_i1~~c16737_g1_i1.p2  ORF type:complete len:210 (-),score=43.10 c16737_g1_i1:246-875(-)
MEAFSVDSGAAVARGEIFIKVCSADESTVDGCLVSVTNMGVGEVGSFDIVVISAGGVEVKSFVEEDTDQGEEEEDVSASTVFAAAVVEEKSFANRGEDEEDSIGPAVVDETSFENEGADEDSYGAAAVEEKSNEGVVEVVSIGAVAAVVVVEEKSNKGVDEALSTGAAVVDADEKSSNGAVDGVSIGASAVAVVAVDEKSLAKKGVDDA